MEIVLGGRQSFGDWDLGLSFNLNYNQNKVLDLAGTGPFISAYGNSDYRTITKEGYPINSFYGLETDGFFQTQAEVDSYATWDGSVGPGDVKYVDQNSDGLAAFDPDHRCEHLRRQSFKPTCWDRGGKIILIMA